MRVKMSKQLPSAPTASALRPCPTIIKSVGHPGTGSLPRTIAPPDNPQYIGVAFHLSQCIEFYFAYKPSRLVCTTMAGKKEHIGVAFHLSQSIEFYYAYISSRLICTTMAHRCSISPITEYRILFCIQV